MPIKVWDEITYPFPNFNGWTMRVAEWVSNYIPWMYLFAHARVKLNHVIEWAPDVKYWELLNQFFIFYLIMMKDHPDWANVSEIDVKQNISSYRVVNIIINN